ncbi:uncharacterized protein LOC105421113 [Amborella trichopoda]|uniref:uncharacterized protein LOC105421113 n=1 Tax=Amborella trichopoda TaxID=13333 RepID=UPI0005D37332|nr:uncharacterized protein LOC105421113 [Amborella trichopoda]|eukprot:XP_011625615.1 uncharacterized protein LOC105421113 [Amborella trichopoda]
MDSDHYPACAHYGKDNHTAAECYKKRNSCLKCGRTNVVANALSRKVVTSVAYLMVREMKLLEDVVEWHPSQHHSREEGMLSCLKMEPQLFQRIRVAQKGDPQLVKILEELKTDGKEDFSMSNDELLRFKDRLCVPHDERIKRATLEEAHHSHYTIHLGSTKMHQGYKKTFWWNNMKRDVAQFVAKCLMCQQVKAKHQKPVGLL